MLKKFVVIAGLSMSIFSMAHAESSNSIPALTQSEKFDVASAVNVLKDAEAQKVTTQNLNEFLNGLGLGHILLPFGVCILGS